MTLLKEVRVKSGRTQADVARGSGVDVYKLSKYETGCARPGPANAEKLADALGMPVGKLFPHLAQKGKARREK